MNRLLVIGGNGQLACAFKDLYPEALFIDRTILDLAHPEKIVPILEEYNPSIIINTAAYTQVDKAETEEALATRVNAESPAEIASWCAGRNIPFIHFSTDYVFDGSGNVPWKETDTPNPINAYGRSKLAGEKAIIKAGGIYLIFRTSWVYDAMGKNFLTTILRLAAEREELRVINDQFGAPTYAPHLAKAVSAVIQKKDFSSGIYHLCGGGETTWYGFANAIIDEAKRRDFLIKVKDIVPIPASEYPLPATRPYNSRLDCHKANSHLKIHMANWLAGVKECGLNIK